MALQATMSAAEDVEEEKVILDVEPAADSFEFAFHSICYQVKDKLILDHITGHLQCGEVLLLMGPSGSGKTTLLQTLAGIRKPTSGELISNNDELLNESAFIAQDDILNGSLTVQETLEYAYDLKKCKHAIKSTQSKEDLIKEVLLSLGLLHVKDVKVGDIFYKGISGGQKRRLSIGIELLSKPKIFFMDEITSGLDSTSAYKIFEILNDLKKNGHIVIMTVHQPSSRLFQIMVQDKFKLMLLSSGKSLFYDYVGELVPYFEKVNNMKFAQFTNPIDEVIDVINTDFDELKTDDTDIGEVLHRKSQQHILPSLQQQYDRLNKMKKQCSRNSRGKSNWNFRCILCELMILLKRNFIVYAKNPAFYWVRIVMYAALSLVIGTLYYDIGTSEHSLRDRISILFFVAAFLVFMSVAALPAFIEGKAIYIRERINNHYGQLSYSVAAFLSMLPWLFLISLVSSTLIYLMVQSNTTGNAFVVYVCNLFLALLIGESLVTLVASLTNQFMIGLACTAGLYGLFMLLCGFFLIPSNIPDGWLWVHYGLSFHRYVFRIFMVNEFRDNDDIQFDGDAVLDQFDMKDADISFDFAILIVFVAVYQILFNIALAYKVRFH